LTIWFQSSPNQGPLSLKKSLYSLLFSSRINNNIVYTSYCLFQAAGN
jgi:hypothetical protein